MRIRLGIWAGGDPTNAQGTVEWAGGPTDFSKAPFAMMVDSINVINYTPAKSYTYKDNSGTYQSIGIDGGTLMSNAGGAVGSAGTTKASTTSTSLSRGSSVPTANPVASNSTTNSTTLVSKTPTQSATASKTSGAVEQTKNAAAGLESMGAASTVVMSCLGFALALFI
jgi:hypothetical protein